MSKQAGKVIYKVLTDDATVSSIVGTKVYPIQMGLKTTYPAVTYQAVSTVPASTKSGPSISVYDVLRLQINTYATTYGGIEELSAAVRTALDGLPLGTYKGVKIKGCYFQNQRELYNEKAAEEGLFILSMDFKLHIG